VARVAAAIRKLQSDGLAAPDLEPHTAAAALCGMVEGFAAHWLGRGESHDEGVATRTLTQLWVRGLGMPARIHAAQGRATAATSASRPRAVGAAPPARAPRAAARPLAEPTPQPAPAVAPSPTVTRTPSRKEPT
jgi:hypothetical protein